MDFVTLIGRDGRILWVSSFVHGQTPENTYGRMIWEFGNSPDQCDVIRSSFNKAMIGEVANYSGRFALSNGDYRFEVVIYPVHNQHGNAGDIGAIAQSRIYPDWYDTLSKREREVVFMAEEPDKQIASKLGCSAGTVRTYKQRACRKIGISIHELPLVKAEIVERLYRQEMIDPNGEQIQ